MTEDPWHALDPPVAESGYSGKRVQGVGSALWGAYWAVDWRRQQQFILIHESELVSQHRLPTLNALCIMQEKDESGQQGYLVFRLTELAHREIFHRFCLSIVDALGTAGSGQEALDTCVLRTWRWHQFLKGKRDKRLTGEEQKGLIGELVLLEQCVIPAIGTERGVRSWVGPRGAHRDFETGSVAIESKACSPTASSLRISSAEQLDSTCETHLFLHALELSESHGEKADSVTVTDVVNRIRKLIETTDPVVGDEYEELLWAVGFNHDDDYSDRYWSPGNTSFYKVVNGFPRITPRMLPAGVTNLNYQIVLKQCSEFIVEETTVVKSMAEGIHDH
ncbi:MAG: PD-(D/E)XK motif protein [Rhodobacteraceae bacterium]|nr:PD-(D/E)XK motif protein [Paracoccaceae bacterium]